MFLNKFSTFQRSSKAIISRFYNQKSNIKPLIKFIAVEGNIGAGKTTLVNKINETIPCKVFHEPVADNPYLEDFYKDPHQYALKTQLWLLDQRDRTYQNALNFLEEVSSTSNNNNIQLCLIDRSVWSDWVFARKACADGFFSENDFKKYNTVRDLIKSKYNISNSFLFLNTTPEECYHRVHHIRKRSYEKAITLDYLKGLHEYYNEFCDEMEKQTKVFRIDWHEFGDSNKVLAEILDNKKQ